MKKVLRGTCQSVSSLLSVKYPAFMKSASLFLLFAAVLCSGCARRGDVLAAYDGGTITRGEFYDWAVSRKIDLVSLKQSKRLQEARLKTMAFEKLAAREALSAGLDKDPAVINLLSLNNKSLLARTYIESKIVQQAGVAEPVRRVRHIFIRIHSNDGKADSPAAKAAEEKVRGILASLSSGKSFEECAAASEDYLGKRKGDQGFILYEMMPEPYAKAAFSLKKGDYTREPVRVPGGLYLIKVTDIDTVTYSTADKIAGDPAVASRMKVSLYAKSVSLYLDRLKKDKDCSFNEEAVRKGTPDSVVFAVGDAKTTVKDLDAFILFVRSRYVSDPHSVVSAEKKIKYASDAWELALINRDAEKSGFAKDETYLRDSSFARDLILSREYLRTVSAFKGVISEQAVRSEYDKNAQARYAVTSQKGMNVERRVLSYSEVRDRIRGELVSREEAALLDGWKKSAGESKHLVIISGKLEGK